MLGRSAWRFSDGTVGVVMRRANLGTAAPTRGSGIFHNGFRDGGHGEAFASIPVDLVRSLFSVHLRDKASELGRRLGGQPVDLVPQPLLIDGADLVHGNFSFLARALDL